MIENLKRGLGVITKLDWITQVPTQTSETIHIRQLVELKEIIIEGSSNTTLSFDDNVEGEVLLTLQTDNNELTKSSLNIITGKNNKLTIAVNIQNTSQAHITTHTLEINEGSEIVWFTQTDGNKQVVLEQATKLVGKNTKVKTITTCFGKESENFDINTASYHLAPHTTSDILFRSVLTSSKVLARGLVHISKDANNSNGYQNSNILLLDKKARAITIPDLEIHNKDVSCSHGSTITSIDDEKLFYLQSRGLTKQEAKETIVKGFIDELYVDLSKEMVGKLRGEVDEE